VLSLVGIVYMVYVFTKPVSFDRLLLQEAREKNRSCPQYVDQETRLDNTTVLDGNVFQYNYTLIKRVKDSIQVEALRSYLEPSIIANIKTNPDLRYQRENNITISFNYKDKNGQAVLKISITPSMYNK
jgi:predicted RNA-binding protein